LAEDFGLGLEEGFWWLGYDNSFLLGL
jgi:hypothetical protein